MGDGFQLLDILLFAAIAGFLVLRLRSVLGRRTGLEQRRDPFTPPARPTQVIPPPRPANGNGAATAAAAAEAPTGTAAIKAADPSFNDATFLNGARGAFQIIVNAYAAGDKSALQPLLSKEVFEPFAHAIDARVAAKEKLQTTLLSLKSAEISEASIEGANALVTVKFVSDQINVTRAADGTVADGDPDKVVEHSDFWTFARSVRARDPNWTLIATQST
jgi:predicted lipid-binding transport protein (Tim44 family)